MEEQPALFSSKHTEMKLFRELEPKAQDSLCRAQESEGLGDTWLPSPVGGASSTNSSRNRELLGGLLLGQPSSWGLSAEPQLPQALAASHYTALGHLQAIFGIFFKSVGLHRLTRKSYPCKMELLPKEWKHASVSAMSQIGVTLPRVRNSGAQGLHCQSSGHPSGSLYRSELVAVQGLTHSSLPMARGVRSSYCHPCCTVKAAEPWGTCVVGLSPWNF